LLLAAALGSLAACDSSSDSFHACTTDLRPAIAVKIEDSVSKLPIEHGVSGYVRDGDYVDSLRVFDGFSKGIAATERPGVYTVVVMKSGYQTWKRDGVRVDHDECHVLTVTLDANLVKLAE
jgi:hypothetical protein